VEFPVTCTVPPEKAGTVRITAQIDGPPPGTPFPVRYTHSDPWGYGGNWIALDSLVPGKAVVVRLEASSADPDHAFYWFELSEVPGRCEAGGLGPVEVPVGDTVDIAIPVRCSSPWDY
jgi:hypothetical protein